MHFLSQLRAPSNGHVISSSVSIPESSSSSSDGGFSPRVLYRFLAFAFSIFRLKYFLWADPLLFFTHHLADCVLDMRHRIEADCWCQLSFTLESSTQATLSGLKLLKNFRISSVCKSLHPITHKVLSTIIWSSWSRLSLVLWFSIRFFISMMRVSPT